MNDQNTRLIYAARGTHNRDSQRILIFSGTLTPAQKTDLVNNLDDGTNFIPDQVDLKNLTDTSTWHTMVCLDTTTDPATETRTIHTLYTQIVATDWRLPGPGEPSGLWSDAYTTTYE